MNEFNKWFLLKPKAKVITAGPSINHADIQGTEGVFKHFIVLITTMKSSHTPSVPCIFWDF